MIFVCEMLALYVEISSISHSHISCHTSSLKMFSYGLGISDEVCMLSKCVGSRGNAGLDDILSSLQKFCSLLVMIPGKSYSSLDLLIRK